MVMMMVVPVVFSNLGHFSTGGSVNGPTAAAVGIYQFQLGGGTHPHGSAAMALFTCAASA